MKTNLKRKRHFYQDDLPSMTQQHFKQECDVNSILERYRKTGTVQHISKSQQQYGDFTMFKDFKENLDTVTNAFQAFDALPAHLRKRFQNDPAQLLTFISDPKNYEEAQNLGIIRVSETLPAKNDDLTTKTQGKKSKENSNTEQIASEK